MDKCMWVGAGYPVLILAIVALWGALSPAIASATADTCPFPLGDSLVTGDVRVVSGSMDAPESLALDVSWYGVLFSEGHFFTDGTRVGVASAHAGVCNNAIAPGELVDVLSGNAIVNGIPVEVSPA